MAPLRVNSSPQLILLLMKSKFKEQNPKPMVTISHPALSVLLGLSLSDFIGCGAGAGT